jgi:type III restriction enzyme
MIKRQQHMALHPDFPTSPHAILDPAIRWFPADEAMRDTAMDKLMPPLVARIRHKVKDFRDSGYAGAAETNRSLLRWWFDTPHLLERADGSLSRFRYYLHPARGPGNDRLRLPFRG